MASLPAAYSLSIARWRTSSSSPAQSLEQGLRLLTGNPATLTGLRAEAGSLAPGNPANLVAVSPDGRFGASFLNGILVSA